MITHAKGRLLIASVIFALAAPLTAFAQANYNFSTTVAGLATADTLVNVVAACDSGTGDSSDISANTSPVVLAVTGATAGDVCAVTANPVPDGYVESPSAGCIVASAVDGTTDLDCLLTFRLLEADLSISKVDTPDPVLAGAELTYTLTVSNAGPDEAVATTVVDTLPVGTTYVSDTAGFGCTEDTPDAGKVSCLVGIIANGGSPSFDIVVAVGADVPDGTELDNAATVASDTFDPDLSNNAVSGILTTVNRESDLSITKTDSLGPVVAGTELTYTIMVENAGPSDAAVTTVVDTLPAGTTYVSDTASFGCTEDTPEAGKVSCLVGIIAPDGSPSFDLVVAVDPGVPHGTTITNVATVSSSSFDPALEDNIDSEDTLVNREATFDITKIWVDEGAGEVEVTLTCSSGTVTPPTSTPASMTVTGFDDGTLCSVTEAVPAGYAPSYSADCNVAGVVSASTYSCEVTNATTTARFQVTKDFSDGSTDDVEVTLTCDTGLPLEQSLTIAGGDPFGVIFVVTDYIDGTMSCSVTEVTNTPGYDMDTSGCVWDNVMTADSPFSCVVNNTARDGTFTVNKDWNVFNEDEGGSEVIEQADVTIWCDAEITNGGSHDYDSDNWYLFDSLGDGESLTARVSTLTGTANCWAYESIDQSGVESSGDCGSRPIVAGGSSSCTFTNTVFFEGIPTLSQYGLALMALLMLGVGMVGFRRFA